MKIEVQFTSTKHSIEFENDQTVTVSDLREALYAKCRVLPKDQKLLGKTKLTLNTEDSVPLVSIGFKVDVINKLMLIGSTVAEKTEALQASDALTNVGVSTTKRLLRKIPGYFWSLGCYKGLLTDAYGGRKDTERSTSNFNLIVSIVALDALFERLNPLGPLMEFCSEDGSSLSYTEAIRGGRDAAEVSLSSRLLEPLLDNPIYHRSFRLAHGVLRRCALFMDKAAEVISPAEVLEVVEGCRSELENLSPQSWLMLPAGWRGKSADNVFFLLITRETKKEGFRMVVVNRGNEGSRYHRRWPTAEKLKSCPLLIFHNIEKEKMLDKCFWLILLSLWIRRNDPQNQSEYIREEVFYDVLLPWLVEHRTSSTQSEMGKMLTKEGENDPFSHLRIPDGVPSNWLESSRALNGENISSTTSREGDSSQRGGGRSMSSPQVLLATNLSLLQPYTTYLEQCGCTPPRTAESGVVKSALTALCWLMCDFSGKKLTAKEVKQVKFAMKLEAYNYAAQDLLRLGRLLVCGEKDFIGNGQRSFATEPPKKTNPFVNSENVQRKEEVPSDTKNTVATSSSSNFGFCAEVPRSGKLFLTRGTTSSDFSRSVSGESTTKLHSMDTKGSRTDNSSCLHEEKEDGVVQVGFLEDALIKLEALGVKNPSKTGPNISNLWKATEEEKIIIRKADGTAVPKEVFNNKMVLVYFAAYDSYGVPQFSELLANATPHLLRPAHWSTHEIEILFVSLDKELEVYEKHAGMFSFHRLSFPTHPCAYNLEVVRPCELLLFSPSGDLIHRAGVSSLRADPLGSTFPFGPCWRGVEPLSFTDQNLIGMGTSIMAHHTRKGLHQEIISARVSERILELLDGVQAVLRELPRDQVISMYNTTPQCENSEALTVPRKEKKRRDEITMLENEENGNAFSSFLGSQDLRNSMSRKLAVSECGQINASFLSLRNTFTHLGKLYDVTVPFLPPVYQCEAATSFSTLHDRLQLAAKTVNALWKRAGHTSTSSRVAEQMHIIEFITWVVTQKIPVPAHSLGFSRMKNTVEEMKVASFFYFEDCFPAQSSDNNTEGRDRGSTQEEGEDSSGAGAASSRPAAAQEGQKGRDMQFEILNSLLYLTISLTNAWQAVETPTRCFDAERTLVAVHLLVVFDAVARQRAGSVRCQLLSNLLHFDGGYYPSTTMSVNNIPFETLSASLELTRPQFLPIRSAIISYLSYLHSTFARELYDFPMPSNSLLEVDRGSPSIQFLRTFIDNAGIALPEESSAYGLSEMERLMECFCSPTSSLNVKFPEFTFFRDMVFLAKFLGTMETRETHLLHRRKALNRFAQWRLSFEESTPGWQMSAGWRTTPARPKWECVLVRGRFMDIADLRVIGFGDRELHYGEGMMIVSPIDVGRLMGIQGPTEDDILHARTLPSFGGSLNQEEAEILLSFLTTPYLRIPLLLDFFSSGDRSSHLFVKDVQDVLRAAVFEPGAYSPELGSSFSVPASNIVIPLPRASTGGGPTSVLQQAISGFAGGNLEATPVQEKLQAGELVLGTSYGLLLNELIRDPGLVLGPIWHLLQKTTAIGTCSVYSIHTSYIFFIIELVCDVLEYGSFALSMTSALPPASRCVIEAFQSKILEFLDRVAYPWLLLWARESEENDDTPTQCVVLNERSMVDRVLWRAASEKLKHFQNISSSSSSAPASNGTEVVLPPSASVVAGGEGQQPVKEEREADAEKVANQHLLRMLQSCAFVRAHHGFGMGLQRTQLSMQHGDAVLTPEENLVRFLQSQGLHIPSMVQSSDLLASVQKLMLCGGRRRAVFLQIVSGKHKDTVRLPNLFRHSPQSTEDARNLKLPPCDVAENRVFFILLDGYQKISSYIRSLPPEGVNEIMNEVARTVMGQSHKAHQEPIDSRGVAQGEGLRENMAPRATTSPTSTTTGSLNSPSSSWTLARSADVIAGPPFSGLVFYYRTGELFWRKKELKPVPDSMSHFSDYEVILGKELRQCGEVLRHEHRHWVQVVGTPYDLMEWTAPNIMENDCGEGRPHILLGDWPMSMVQSALWESVLYDRMVAVGEGEGQQPWPVERERWAVNMVRLWLEMTISEIKVFPLAPSLENMKNHSFCYDAYHYLLPTGSDAMKDVKVDANGPEDENKNKEEADRKEEYGKAEEKKGVTEAEEDDLSEMHFILNDAPQYTTERTRATWKELVAYKYPEPYLEVYNLVSHGRCMYRSLVFSSNQKLSLHSLPSLPLRWKEGKEIRSKAFAAGLITDRIYCESSLEIHRYNELLKGREKYLPPRLIQGVLPGVLLEAFSFWIGEDNVIRGYEDPTQNNRDTKDRVQMDSLIEEHQMMKTAGSSSSPNTNDASRKNGKGDGEKKTREGQQEDLPSQGPSLDQWHHFSVEVFLKRGKAFVVRRNDHYYTPIFDHLSYQHPRGCPHSENLRTTPTRSIEKRKNGEVSDSYFPQEDDNMEMTECASTKPSDCITPEWERSIALLRAAIHQPHEVCLNILDKFDGDAHKALQWAVQPSNADAVEKVCETVMKAMPSSMATSGVCEKSAPISLSQRIRPHVDLVLVSIHSCRHLHQLFSLLTGLEDASHILVWARRVTASEETQKSSFSHFLVSAPSEEDKEECCLCIESVELPRLRARFVLQHEGGVSSAPLHLFLADYPGWRLAETEDLDSSALQKLSTLRETFQQSIGLCNSIHEVAVMVPNHSFTPLSIENDPLNPFLIFDRGNFSWQEAVSSPFYLYTLHSSGFIVIPQTLSASLYLAALQCGTQHYAEAMTTLEACYTDTLFTHEESFMYDLFQFTQGDTSPDATAVHLKAAHALQYSPNKYEWLELDVELHRYLEMIPHVSSNCRLTFHELLDLIKRCEKASTLVQIPLKVHHARVKQWPEMSSFLPSFRPAEEDDVVKVLEDKKDNISSNSSTGTAMTTMTIPAICPIGLCWDRLLLQPWGRVVSQKLHRVTFLRPTMLDSPSGVVEFLWKDLLLTDEESGANTRLGFFFLYNVQNGTIPIRIGADDYTKSFASIMGRWFHLRHALWGREHDEISKGPQGPSWCATVLQLMALCPEAGWPNCNLLREAFPLRYGVSLGPVVFDDPQIRARNQSNIPALFKDIETIAEKCFSSASDDNSNFRNVEEVGTPSLVLSTENTSILKLWRASRQVRYAQLTGKEYLSKFPITKHLPSTFDGTMRHRNNAQSSVKIWCSSLKGEPSISRDKEALFTNNVEICLEKTLFALCHQPLLEVEEVKDLLLPFSISSVMEDSNQNYTKQVGDTEKKEERSSNNQEEAEDDDNDATETAPCLPFNLRDHPLAGSAIAQGMLQRLEKDFRFYTIQQRMEAKKQGRKKVSSGREGEERTSIPNLSCITPDIVNLIVFSSDSTEIAQSFSHSLEMLEAAAEALRRLQEKDHQAVSSIASTILRTANALIPRPLLPTANTIASTTTASSGSKNGSLSTIKKNAIALQREADEGQTIDPKWVQHRLQLYHRDRVPLRMEWLCGGLLSTELEEEINEQNPYHGDIAQLRCHLVLLMLFSNRSHLAMQALALIEQVKLFLQLCRLLRGIPDNLVHADVGAQLASITQRARELHILFALEISPAALETLLARCGSYLRMVNESKNFQLEVPQLPEEVGKLLYNRLWHLGDSVREVLSAQRCFIESCRTQSGTLPSGIAIDSPSATQLCTTTTTSWYTLDPRFLMMEFLFNILLRRRQVEMTRWFIQELRAGRSRVQQMIMGQGKTSIVAPLLTLMLADGQQLVTQVMPTALVEQTRAVLRRCFGVVIVKHVFTLQFDRTRGDDRSTGGWEVEGLLTKLQSAVTDRAVVVAAPESLKSLFLKYIEQLHLLESIVPYEPISHDAREIALATRSEERAKACARVVDAIAPILALWRDGVLLMDEVDVLLHPLRSELNFPIAEKDSIDMSGPRWGLPIHLLDLLSVFRLPGGTPSSCTAEHHSPSSVPPSPALLFAERQFHKSHTKRLKSVRDQKKFHLHQNEKGKEAKESSDSSGGSSENALPVYPVNMETEEDRSVFYRDVARAFHRVLLKGLRQHSLQREPHLVLLDINFYEEEMLPLWVKWAQLWVLEELQEYLYKQVLPCRAPWDCFETMRSATNPFFYNPDRLSATNEAEVLKLLEVTPGYGVKLLNLAHDWLHRLLPHVLGKINRVNFGLLQPSDLKRFNQEAIEVMPLSRKLTAVPFVAKDVPSTSSEFAHPDVAIGLTILAFCYEGLRLGDTRRLLQELKKDFSQQLGPKDIRPAALLYQEWIQHSVKASGATAAEEEEDSSHHAGGTLRSVEGGPNEGFQKGGTSSLSSILPKSHSPFVSPVPGSSSIGTFRSGKIVPLSHLQLTDTYQLNALHQLLRRVPDVVYYYLIALVFPRTMLFHRLKVSACGHELGSSMLFGRRLGFSGTPSDLLPLDLGACKYEVGSDARVLSVLTDPEVVRVEVLDEDWTPLRVLDRIAAAQPPFYALIDAGALITNMNNPDVAAYLLSRLPPYLFDGVVYLDERDEQMIQQRQSGIAVPVAQCGIPVSRRFVFFDQVHTTGTDVKQAASASAVMTLGKDLTFRDYAQGAYRMRGIGNGQKLCLYLIPEVLARMKAMLSPSSPESRKKSGVQARGEEKGCEAKGEKEKKEKDRGRGDGRDEYVSMTTSAITPSTGQISAVAETSFETGNLLLDTPAWLMLNSMKMESLQYLKLSLQELSNVWRKKAYYLFLGDCLHAAQHRDIFTVQRRAAMFRVKRVDVGDDQSSAVMKQIKGEHSSSRSSLSFSLPTLAQMRTAMIEFREEVGYPVPATFEAPRPFQAYVEELLAHRPALVGNAAGTSGDGEKEENAVRDLKRAGEGIGVVVNGTRGSATLNNEDREKEGHMRGAAEEYYQRSREIPLEEVITKVMERLRFFLRSSTSSKGGRERNETGEDGKKSDIRCPPAGVSSLAYTENTFTNLSLSAEMVHEREAEEQQEEEAEEEEQREVIYSRDDEKILPWRLDTLKHCGFDASSTVKPSHGCCFYQLRGFSAQHDPPGQFLHQLDPNYLVSDNYFRLEWSGRGERRLKNAVLFMEWCPIPPSQESTSHVLAADKSKETDTDTPPASSLQPQEDKDGDNDHSSTSSTVTRGRAPERPLAACTHSPPVCFGLVSLLEGESMRWLLHRSRDVWTPLCLSSSTALLPPVESEPGIGKDSAVFPISALNRVGLRLVRTGRTIASIVEGNQEMLPTGSKNWGMEEELFMMEEEVSPFPVRTEDSPDTKNNAATIAALLFRFFNNDMFFTEVELDLLLRGALAKIPPPDRLRFFKECMRCRRRLTQRWEETPVASLFLSPKELPFRTQLSSLFFLQNNLQAMTTKLVENIKMEFLGEGRSSTVVKRANLIERQIHEFNAELKNLAISLAHPQNTDKRIMGQADGKGEEEEEEKKKEVGVANVGIPSASLASLVKKYFSKETSAFNVQDLEEALLFGAWKNKASASFSFRILTMNEFYEIFPFIHPEQVSKDRITSQIYMLYSSITVDEQGNSGGRREGGKQHSMEPWACPVCTLVNEAAFGTCSACGSRRPIRESVGEDNDDTEEDAAWACEACTFINDSRRQAICSVCLTPNPNILQTSSTGGGGGGDAFQAALMSSMETYCPEDHWVCSLEHGGCSKVNPKTEFYCTACEKSRPGLAHVRF